MTKKQVLELIAKGESASFELKRDSLKPDFAADEDSLMINIDCGGAKFKTINETINETIKLEPIQKDILREIISNPAATYEEISGRIGVNRTTVARNIGVLKKTGIISRMGSRKTGYWKVNNDKYSND